MGYLQASEFARLTDLPTGIEWHLTGNHLPAVDRRWIPVAIEAVEAARDEDPERLIKLPENIVDNAERDHAPAWQIIEEFRLEPFCFTYDDEEDEA